MATNKTIQEHIVQKDCINEEDVFTTTIKLLIGAIVVVYGIAATIALNVDFAKLMMVLVFGLVIFAVFCFCIAYYKMLYKATKIIYNSKELNVFQKFFAISALWGQK